jgi:hypothetical protein
LVSPLFGFDAAEAAGDPIGGDEDIEQKHSSGLELFAADDFAIGPDARQSADLWTFCELRRFAAVCD